MPGTVVVIQCGSTKRKEPARARDLYLGAYFNACRAAAERIGDRWYIVSAKHGLLTPSRIIAPYNATLPLRGDREWGERVRCALLEAEPDGWDRLIALAGRRYLVGWGEELGAETPLARAQGIGSQVMAANRLRRSA